MSEGLIVDVKLGVAVVELVCVWVGVELRVVTCVELKLGVRDELGVPLLVSVAVRVDDRVCDCEAPPLIVWVPLST